MDKQGILSEIRQTAEANGGVPLGMARFFQETGIKPTDWEGKFWVRWGDAVREAGFHPNQFNAAYDTTILIEKYVSLVRELGKFPVRRELRLKNQTDKSSPSVNVLSDWGPSNKSRHEFWTTAKAGAVMGCDRVVLTHRCTASRTPTI